MIRLDQVSFSYPSANFSLHIPLLEIARGEKVAFVGPSGSGKTTLLNLMSGILLPARGSVTMGERVVSTMSDAARRSFRISNIGQVFQRFELVEYLTVRDNILLPYLINGSMQLDGDVRRRVETSAQQMGFQDKLKRWPNRLSQGEQQRVAIGRAILPRPRWILADEPTGSLDPENKQKIIELLFAQSRENNSTLVIVTHDTAILEGFDRIIDFMDFQQTTSETVSSTDRTSKSDQDALP